jgi:4-hydroxymandelate oxidase
VVSDAQVLANIGPLADLSLAGQATGVTFADIGWLARLGVPVLVKGVLRPDDARACVDAGAAGVIVSNHDGRQVDRALPTALGLGARTVFLGRPVLWALACDGADGVRIC